MRQFHFHKPSEHLIDGKQYEMESHFVFFNKDKVGFPKAVVLGVMILDGPANVEVGKLWRFLPPHREGYGEGKTEMSDWREAAATNELQIEGAMHHDKTLGKDIAFDLRKLLPAKADFMIYNGSLTTPSCDEGITHAVALAPLYMTHEQVEHFEGYYEGSNHDVQPTGDISNRNFRHSAVAR